MVKMALINNSKWIRISVIDTGVGISKESQKNLFKEFSQVETEDQLKLNPNGTGLGLISSHNMTKILGPKNSKGI